MIEIDIQSAWRRSVGFVRRALRDTEEDFTSGPVGRALGLLAIPMMLARIIRLVFKIIVLFPPTGITSRGEGVTSKSGN